MVNDSVRMKEDHDQKLKKGASQSVDLHPGSEIYYHNQPDCNSQMKQKEAIHLRVHLDTKFDSKITSTSSSLSLSSLSLPMLYLLAKNHAWRIKLNFTNVDLIIWLFAPSALASLLEASPTAIPRHSARVSA